jgi:hypothetical protein
LELRRCGEMSECKYETPNAADRCQAARRLHLQKLNMLTLSDFRIMFKTKTGTAFRNPQIVLMAIVAFTLRSQPAAKGIICDGGGAQKLPFTKYKQS